MRFVWVRKASISAGVMLKFIFCFWTLSICLTKTEEERKQLKGLRYLLLKKDEKLTAKEKQRLQALKTDHPQLYELTRLRQRLYEWYETDHSLEEATRELNQWLEDAQTLACKPLNAFCQTLQNWQTEIVNFFSPHHQWFC